MELEEAKELLSICHRNELRDHYFGDREVNWMFGEIEVAWGYFSSESSDVTIAEYHPNGEAEKVLATFVGSAATELVKCGSTVTLERNDQVGPAQYRGA